MVESLAGGKKILRFYTEGSTERVIEKKLQRKGSTQTAQAVEECSFAGEVKADCSLFSVGNVLVWSQFAETLQTLQSCWGFKNRICFPKEESMQMNYKQKKKKRKKEK